MTARLYGHRDFIRTSCPGNKWLEWVPQLRSLAEEDDMEFPELTRHMAHIRQKLDPTTKLTAAQRKFTVEERQFNGEMRAFIERLAPRGGPTLKEILDGLAARMQS